MFDEDITIMDTTTFIVDMLEEDQALALEQMTHQSIILAKKNDHDTLPLSTAHYLKALHVTEEF